MRNQDRKARKNFDNHAAKLPTYFATLEACVPATRSELAKRIPKDTAGIYAFYHNDQPVYVGRTRDLRRRLGEHGRVGSTHYSASFAFLRARRAAEAKGHVLTGKSRAELSDDKEIFKPFFVSEKAVVASMAVRWVVVDDAVTQALLEVYAALALETEFNSFVTS
ncbi:hypothetical protein GCM10022409_16930 [Hymenobacter glaciei]|uniref:GIY-YIG domain-containing protein n=1 Tax=Hymenobacter glaciei TaxID=877209 RepID=A0ABP7TYR0_9BACT